MYKTSLSLLLLSFLLVLFLPPVRIHLQIHHLSSLIPAIYDKKMRTSAFYLVALLVFRPIVNQLLVQVSILRPSVVSIVVSPLIAASYSDVSIFVLANNTVSGSVSLTLAVISLLTIAPLLPLIRSSILISIISLIPLISRSSALEPLKALIILASHSQFKNISKKKRYLILYSFTSMT